MMVLEAWVSEIPQEIGQPLRKNNQIEIKSFFSFIFSFLPSYIHRKYFIESEKNK